MSFAQVGWQKLHTSDRWAETCWCLQNIGTDNDEGGPGSREVPILVKSSATRYTGSSSYNALQSKLEKRFVKGLSILSFIHLGPRDRRFARWDL